jgi:hypothetical protein
MEMNFRKFSISEYSIGRSILGYGICVNYNTRCAVEIVNKLT